MLKTRAIGVIFANMHDAAVPEMTSMRSMASLPFGGRYRMIDFYLSALNEAGISQVAVVTKSNYQSLMDHIGSGRAWNMARRKGISILPPYSYSSADQNSAYHGRISAMYGILDYLNNATSDIVVLMDTDHVCSLDLDAIIQDHIKRGADVTMACRVPDYELTNLANCICVRANEQHRIEEMLMNRCDHGFLQSMNVFVLSRKLLIELVQNANARMQTFFERDVLASQLDKLVVNAYYVDSYVRRITSVKSYYDVSLELTDPKNIDALFGPRRIYTKTHDSPPARYGLNCKAINSVIADGGTIDGTVDHSVLFRGVVIEPGAVVRNCILMQNTRVESGAVLENVITDKDVVVKANQMLTGSSSYPLYIKKHTVVGV